MTPSQKYIANRADQVDGIVSNFTRKILDLARKQNVDFDYVGGKGNKASEINRTMTVNSKAVRDLLGK